MKRWKWGISLAVAIVVAVLSVPAQAGPPVDNPSSLNLTELLNRVAVLEGMVVTLQSALDAETAARLAAESALQTALSNEIAARSAADATLQTSLNNMATALNQEAVARLAADDDLAGQIADSGAIPGLNDYVSVDTSTHTVLFSGANVQIVNGMGSTDIVNGRGNLIVGYNLPRDAWYPICSEAQYDNEQDCIDNGKVWALNHKSGSHNIVGGDYNAYSSWGGLIVGYRNAINSSLASVTGGAGNVSSAAYSSVSGGFYNTASGGTSSVSGGEYNTASGSASSVSGGNGNTASGSDSSVSGGVGNTASAPFSSVSGGEDNTASGDRSSSVSGGQYNTASGRYSSVSGGYNRSASDYYDWAAGELFQDQ